MSYLSQTKKGIYWVAAAQVASKALGFLRSLLLYRLLARSLLGVVGMADLVLNALLLFQEMGFTSALIYRKDRTEDAADTTFWTVMASSILLFAITFFGAEPIISLLTTDADAQVTVVPVLRVLALTIPISGLSMVQLVVMTKDLDLKSRVVPETLASAANLAVVLAMAAMGYGVWAIVWGRLVEGIVLTVLVWVISPWRPRLRYHRALAGEMFNYARHIIGSQILIFFIKNLDDAFVSRFLGVYSLGGYEPAYSLANRPATEITRLFGVVMFPAFSKVQDNIAEMRHLFLRTTRYIAYVSIPLSVCIAVFAEDFLLFAYGSKFADIVWPLRVLTVYGLLRSIAANMGGVLKAGGKPQWLFRIAAVRLVVMAVLLYPATIRFGILGVSVLSTVVSIIDFVASTWLVNRIVQARLGDYVSMLVPPFLIAAAAGAVGAWVYPYLSFMKGYFSLPLAGGLVMGLYAIVLWLTDADARHLVRSLLDDARRGGRMVLRPREG